MESLPQRPLGKAESLCIILYCKNIKVEIRKAPKFGGCVVGGGCVMKAIYEYSMLVMTMRTQIIDIYTLTARQADTLSA